MEASKIIIREIYPKVTWVVKWNNPISNHGWQGHLKLYHNRTSLPPKEQGMLLTVLYLKCSNISRPPSTGQTPTLIA